MRPLVSVVIPTCGRPELLRRCLEALELQTLPADSYEIIVVDDTHSRHGLERAEFVTANCFVRKHALERVGGFDESFRMPWREDSDLQFRLLCQGFTIVRDDSAVLAVISLALGLASPWRLASGDAPEVCRGCAVYNGPF